MNKSNKYTLHSGGALGADYEWGKASELLNCKINHYYIEGFKTKYGNIPIPHKESLKADIHLHKANERLKRKFPTTDDFVNSLLRRNYWQVKNSDAIYAISTIKNNIVQGGTGWACQMAINLKKDVFVFDQDKCKWYYWDLFKFEEIDTPILTKNFAGIGTRKINENGKNAIKEIFDKTLNYKYPEYYTEYKQKYNHIFVKLSNLEKEGLERDIYYLPSYNDDTRVPLGNEPLIPNKAVSDVKLPWQQNVGMFREELLKNNIKTTFDAIRKGYRTGTSRAKIGDLKVNDIINLGDEVKHLYGNIVRIYRKPLKFLLQHKFMTVEEWSKREGWNEDYIKRNPKVLDKYLLDFTIKKGKQSLTQFQIIMGLRRLDIVASKNKNKLFFMEDNINHKCGYSDEYYKQHLFKENIKSKNIIFRV